MNLSSPNKFKIDDFPQLFLNDHKHGSKFRQVFKNTIQKKQSNNDCNLLKKVFFSNKNFDIINKNIVLTVWKKTNKQIKIGLQSKNRLNIAMEYVFLYFSKNLTTNIKHQIIELNNKVVCSVVPDILSNIKQKIDYLKDIEKIREPNQLPVNSSSLDRTLPSVTNIFH